MNPNLAAQSTVTETERERLRYEHIERMFTLVIVAMIALGGLIILAMGNPTGLTILTAVVALFGGYKLGVGAKRSGRPNLR